MSDMITEADLPEHVKLKAAKARPATDAVADFFDWLQRERGLRFCRAANGREERLEFGPLVPANLGKDALIADFFGIDLARLDAEKRKLLDALREAQDENARLRAEKERLTADRPAPGAEVSP